MKLKALQTFSSGFEGDIKNGQEFTASKERAEFLIEGGYAESVEAEPVQVATKK